MLQQLPEDAGKDQVRKQQRLVVDEVNAIRGDIREILEYLKSIRTEVYPSGRETPPPAEWSNDYQEDASPVGTHRRKSAEWCLVRREARGWRLESCTVDHSDVSSGHAEDIPPGPDPRVPDAPTPPQGSSMGGVH